MLAGNASDIFELHHPWAQCYGGYQFGQWASQLGDGRVVSLFEVQAEGKDRFELQLKGAGMTPYSRFADGNAVLRSSIREFLVSEHLNALGLPTTRALALTLLPERKALRERIEPCAIVTRCAPSWIRFGTFDLLRRRGDRKTIKVLADYVIEHVYGGDEKLLANLRPSKTARNRYVQLYRQVVRRTATLAAKMQGHGFLNGVLNTDNTSVLGLCIDFGPFSFLDTFDSSYTPNHDDAQLRYSYKMQPTIFWWNCLRLGEALGELMGCGDNVAEMFGRADFLAHEEPEDVLEPVLAEAERIITDCSEDFRYAFREEYKRTMSRRLGVPLETEADLDLVSNLLEVLESCELDFPTFFVGLCEPDATGSSIIKDMQGNFGGLGRPAAEDKVDSWLTTFRRKLQQSSVVQDDEWRRGMLQSNPRFVLRNWILDEVIRRVEKDGERAILSEVLHCCTHPYDDYRSTPAERYCAPPASGSADLQCSCSS